jgi:hypothetical protein
VVGGRLCHYYFLNYDTEDIFISPQIRRPIDQSTVTIPSKVLPVVTSTEFSVYCWKLCVVVGINQVKVKGKETPGTLNITTGKDGRDSAV